MIDVDTEPSGGRIAQSGAFGADSRALSTPVTHALTIAITGLLMVALVSTASGFLTDQKEFAARDELETIGNRLADDLQEVVTLGNTSGKATVYVNQPDSIVGHQYHVTYETGPACDTGTVVSDSCLALSVVNMDVSQTVPISAPDDVSLEISRAGPSTFKLTAQSTTASSGNDAVVPMSRTMRVGVGRSVDSNSYGEVIDPSNEDPVASFTLRPSYPESGDPITVDATGSYDPDEGGTIIDYRWYIDGSLVASGSETHQTTLSPGKHNVTLVVEDNEGGVSPPATDRIRVSGLEYNDNLVAGSGGGSRCVV